MDIVIITNHFSWFEVVRLRLEIDFYLKTTTTTIRQFALGFFELRLYQPHAISSQKPRARSQIVQQLLQACAHPRLVQFLKIAGQRGGVATVFRSLHPPASVFDIIFRTLFLRNTTTTQFVQEREFPRSR